MTTEQAKELLSFHSGRHEDIDNPKWKDGFLGSLRPYQGKLIEDNFHEVISCLRILSEGLCQEKVEQNVVSDIMGIIHLGRAWGIYENGMLKRNKLISEKDSRLLESWIEIISYTFMMILDTGDEEIAFEEYKFYNDENT